MIQHAAPGPSHRVNDQQGTERTRRNNWNDNKCQMCPEMGVFKSCDW